MVPARDSIHDLVFDMEKQSLVNLNVSIRSYAEIMEVFVAMVAVEIALELVGAAQTYFPRVEDAVTHLRCDGQTKVIPRHSETEVAAVNHFPFQIGHLREKLCRHFATKTH